MPESKRIEAARDLTPEGYAQAKPLLDEIEELEDRWTRDGDEEAYARWRTLLAEVQVIIQQSYVGRAAEPS